MFAAFVLSVAVVWAAAAAWYVHKRDRLMVTLMILGAALDGAFFVWLVSR